MDQYQEALELYTSTDNTIIAMRKDMTDYGTSILGRSDELYKIQLERRDHPAWPGRCQGHLGRLERPRRDRVQATTQRHDLRLDQPPPAKLPLTLLLALPRPLLAPL